MKEQTFQTERLLITPTSMDDAPLILALLNTPKWLENIGDRNVHNLEDAKNYIASKIRPQYDRLGYGNFTLSLLSDGTQIGTCGLYDREGLNGVDIGFALLPAFEGKGYGYESASKIQELGYEVFKVNEINAITIESNIASQNLIKKLGLKFIKMVNLPNDSTDLMFFSQTKEMYLKNPGSTE